MRLATYLFVRILIMGTDKRFDNIRDKVLAFFTFWMLQAVTVWIVILPTMFLFATRGRAGENPPIGALDIVGWTIAVIGIIIETISDYQKFIFKIRSHDNDVV